MKFLAIILILAAVPLGAFCAWGLLTSAGQHKFDEMDALYPMIAGVAAGVLAIAGVILFLISR